MMDGAITKGYVDERERGVGRRMDDVEKAVFPKTAAKAKAWGKGVLPTRQQKQAAGIVGLTAAGGAGGVAYRNNKRGNGTLPPAVRRAAAVAKAQRTADPEYDRARRRGTLQGTAVGAAIPLGYAGRKTFEVVGQADMKGGKARSWKGKSIGVRSRPSGGFPKGRAAALGASGALLTGAAMSQRRGTKERNRRWT